MMTEDEIAAVLAEHYPSQGVMASPGHWAYHKGWFAYCGTSHEDQKGCGWTSEPHTFPDRMEARKAALAHVAAEIKKAEPKRCQRCLRRITFDTGRDAWADETNDPFYCPRALNFDHKPLDEGTLP